jgi:hypothetical protein
MGLIPGAESYLKMSFQLIEGNNELHSYLTFVDGHYHEF